MRVEFTIDMPKVVEVVCAGGPTTRVTTAGARGRRHQCMSCIAAPCRRIASRSRPLPSRAERVPTHNPMVKSHFSPDAVARDSPAAAAGGGIDRPQELASVRPLQPPRNHASVPAGDAVTAAGRDSTTNTSATSGAAAAVTPTVARLRLIRCTRHHLFVSRSLGAAIGKLAVLGGHGLLDEHFNRAGCRR